MVVGSVNGKIALHVKLLCKDFCSDLRVHSTQQSAELYIIHYDCTYLYIKHYKCIYLYIIHYKCIYLYIRSLIGLQRFGTSTLDLAMSAVVQL